MRYKTTPGPYHIESAQKRQECPQNRQKEGKNQASEQKEGLYIYIIYVIKLRSKLNNGHVTPKVKSGKVLRFFLVEDFFCRAREER
mgnify:CR=1 FL=1